MKKFWSVIAAGALISSAFTVGNASAQEAPPPIPETANIEDVAADANFHSTLSGQATGPSLRAADYLKVWFTNDAENIYTHILTDGPPGAVPVMYQVYVDPGVGVDCLQFRGYTAGPNNKAFANVFADGKCGALNVRFDEGIKSLTTDKSQGLTTITIPRSSSDYFADGSVLSIPNGLTRVYVDGAGGLGIADSTAEGTPYTITGGATPPPASEEPKEEKPGKDPKSCKKGKGKKKGCGKGKGGKTPEEPKAPGCAAYTPGEQGAEAENLSVTSANTAEAPLEITVDQKMGMANDLGLGRYDGTAHAFRNVQVDSDGSEAGLYIRYVFPAYEDHDLYVNYADGTEAAHVGGFNAAPVNAVVINFDGTGSGGHSERGAEQLDGLRTPDCGGYTVDFSNYLGQGGKYKVLMWLGEIKNDPAAPAKAVK